MSAAFAAFIGALWAWQYISSSMWAYRPFVDYILGNEYMGLNEEMTGVLLVVLIRFVLGFGFTWLPLKLVGTLAARIGIRGKTTPDGGNAPQQYVADDAEPADKTDEKLLDSPTGNAMPSESTITLPKWAVTALGIIIVLVLFLVTLMLM